MWPAFYGISVWSCTLPVENMHLQVKASLREDRRAATTAHVEWNPALDGGAASIGPFPRLMLLSSLLRPVIHFAYLSVVEIAM